MNNYRNQKDRIIKRNFIKIYLVFNRILLIKITFIVYLIIIAIPIKFMNQNLNFNIKSQIVNQRVILSLGINNLLEK